MSISNVFSTSIQDSQNFVSETVLNLPIHVENKLRRDMISSVFIQYGKFLIDKGTPINEVYKSLQDNLETFKNLNRTYCNADYETSTMKEVEKYYYIKKHTKNEIAKTFINKCASYLKENIKNINDIDVIDNLDKAEESLVFTTDVNKNTTKLNNLVGYYLEACKEKIKSSCDLDPSFLNLL